MMLKTLLVGLVAGLITAGIFHFAYNRLRHKPTLQLKVFITTLFLALVPGLFFGLADMAASNATWYWQADLSRSTLYILGWMLTSFLGFAFVHVFPMRKHG